MASPFRFVKDYVCSLHYFPLIAGTTTSAGLYAYGALKHSSSSKRWSAVALVAGAAVSAFAFANAPLRTLRCQGGEHHVSVRDIDATIERGWPPVTVTYPTASAPPPGGFLWLPFRETHYLRGMAAYAKMPYFFLKDYQLIRVAASKNAKPLPLFQPDGTPRKLILLSHGLSAYAQLHTVLTIDLAARGAIVFAMTHMDTSAAYCRDSSGSFGVSFNDRLQWLPDDREPQLRQRIRETVSTLGRLTSGELLRAAGYAEDDVHRFLSTQPTVTLLGHSFGGATVLATALAEHNADDVRRGTRRNAIGAVVALDPWHIPLQRGLFMEPIQRGDQQYATPTLQFHSEEWIRLRDSFEFFTRVKDVVLAQKLNEADVKLVKDANAKLEAARQEGEPAESAWFTMRLCQRTGHLSYTDMILLSPTFHRYYVTAPRREQLVRWVEQTLAFASA